MTDLAGIHHVTAICGDPQRNVDFYGGVLGLRLVKKTVNFDDPTTYHLYFGDDLGRPGTILTFFPWPGAVRGRRGAGQVTTTSFRVPEGSLDYWRQRLEAHGSRLAEPTGEAALRFEDPDGLRLELVGVPEHQAGKGGFPAYAFSEGPVPLEHAVRGVDGVVLTQRALQATSRLLVDALGFREVEPRSGRRRFRGAAAAGQPGLFVDVREQPDADHGRVAVGTVHHVAFRTPDRDAQEAWRRRLTESGVRVTEIRDRRYFTSIYFREPGGALFEIATDGPGFTADEAPERLGSALRLPPWLEGRRAELESVLPPVHAPTARIP